MELWLDYSLVISVLLLLFLAGAIIALIVTYRKYK